MNESIPNGSFKKTEGKQSHQKSVNRRSRRAAEWKQLNAVPEVPKDHKDQESLQDAIMEPQTGNMVEEKGAKRPQRPDVDTEGGAE